MTKKLLSFAFITSLIAGLATACQMPEDDPSQLDETTPVAEQISDQVSQLKDTAVTQVNTYTGDMTVEPAPPLVESARKQIGVTTGYNPAYVGLDFPMGDVPKNTGVCTDVVVRAYRTLPATQTNGQLIDLQALVNADMKQAWGEYPKTWGLSRPDPNIDHRRVPNLQTFFARHGDELPISDNGTDYQAGDIVTWDVSGRPHIGIVSNKRLADGTPLIIHNIGRGTQEEDILFAYPITGHYRYAVS